MPRQPEIRWRESDLQELRRVVKNYNAKITRERNKLLKEEKRYQAAQLPKKASVKELRQAIGTRKEFKQELSTLQNYIKTCENYLIDGNTRKSLHATVRDFNMKIDKLQVKIKKEGLSGAQLPDKISAHKLKNLAKDKENLQRLIKEHKEFLHRGAEEMQELPNTQLNIKLTKWQYDLMQQGVEEVNKLRAQERKAWEQAEVKYNGKSAGYTRGEAGQIGMDADGKLPDMTLYTKWAEYHDLKKKWELIIRERQKGYWDARTELARVNYMQTVKNCMGNDPVGRLIIREINKMPLEDFKRNLTEQGDLFDIQYRFKEEGNESARTEILNRIWNEWFPDKDLDTWLAEDKALKQKRKAQREALKQKKMETIPVRYRNNKKLVRNTLKKKLKKGK